MFPDAGRCYNNLAPHAFTQPPPSLLESDRRALTQNHQPSGRCGASPGDGWWYVGYHQAASVGSEVRSKLEWEFQPRQ